MARVTNDQIERARQVDVLEYILTHEPNNVKRVGHEYRLKDHDSLAVTNEKWYWHSHNIGGRTAIDYLTAVRGYNFIEAVLALTGERSFEKSETPKNDTAQISDTHNKPFKPDDNKPSERIPLVLPIRNKDNRRVIAYLQSRGIDRDLILDCINRGSLYESIPFHNIIFTGKDENGRTRFASMRGITSNFKRDADGSDKRYGFILPPIDPNNKTVAVFESPIDGLSHQTLCKNGNIPPFDGWRLSLGCTSVLALEHFLEIYKDITRCVVCTDNDEAGKTAATKISGLPGIASERSPPIYGNDWNDTLLSMQKTERGKKSERDKNYERG